MVGIASGGLDWFVERRECRLERRDLRRGEGLEVDRALVIGAEVIGGRGGF